MTAFGCCVYYLRKNLRKVLPLAWLLVGVSVATSGLYLIDHSVCNTNTFTLYNPAGMGYGYISGMEYLIANGNTGNVYLVSAESAGSRQLRGVPATVDGSTITITDDEAELTVFTCYLESSIDPNSTRLKIDSQDLYTNNANGLRMFTMTSEEANKHWHYRADRNLLWFFKDDGTNTESTTCSK